jgi:hypothetical protein
VLVGLNAVLLWLLPILFCAPWIVANALVWAHLPKDGSIPPSAGDRARQRLPLL